MFFYLVDFGSEPTTAPGSAHPFMNEELSFGPATYSFLASIAFTGVFAPVSLVAGTLADSGDRATLSWASCLAWSAATVWQASASSVGELAATRGLQGAAMAFTTPAAYTLLAERTPLSRRGVVNSVYACGVYVGGGAAALSIILDRAIGWRGALYASAASGVALAVASAALLRDGAPRPAGEWDVGAVVSSQVRSLRETVGVMWGDESVRLLLLSSALRFCAGFSIAVWIGPWGRLAFPEREQEFAFAKAFISTVVGSISVVAGGALSDALSVSAESRRLWVPAVGSILAAICWSEMIDAETFEAAMAWLLLQYLVAECWFGSAVAVLQRQLPPEVQGGAQGVFSTLTVVGNAAPLAIGALQARSSLPEVLKEVVPVLYVASAACFLATSWKISANHSKT